MGQNKDHSSQLKFINVSETEDGTNEAIWRHRSVFCCYNGIVHYVYAPPDPTVIKVYYWDVLKRLLDAGCRKSKELHASSLCQLHHNNAPVHSLQQFLTKYDIPPTKQLFAILKMTSSNASHSGNYTV